MTNGHRHRVNLCYMRRFLQNRFQAEFKIGDNRIVIFQTDEGYDLMINTDLFSNLWDVGNYLSRDMRFISQNIRNQPETSWDKR